MAERKQIDDKGNVKKTDVEQTKNTAPNLETVPGNEGKPVAMPEKTFVKEINPQDGTPAVPSRAPEDDAGNSLSTDLHKTDADKQAVREYTDQRAKLNVEEAQNTKPRPNHAGALTVEDMAPVLASPDTKIHIPEGARNPVEELINSLKPENIPLDEIDQHAPSDNTIDRMFPPGAPIKRLDIASVNHPRVPDVSESNRQFVAALKGKSGRGNAVSELLPYVDNVPDANIRRLLQLQLVLKNTSMDSQQQEKVLAQVSEIFSS